MGVSQKHIGPLILAKIQIFSLTRAELLFTLCSEIPCNTDIAARTYNISRVFFPMWLFLGMYRSPMRLRQEIEIVRVSVQGVKSLSGNFAS